MDLATLVGLIGGFAIVIFAMVLGGSLGMFVDVPSILIVLVGSTLVCMMKFSLGQCLGATKTVAKAFAFKLDSPEELIANVKELAEESRKGGLMARVLARSSNRAMSLWSPDFRGLMSMAISQP